MLIAHAILNVVFQCCFPTAPATVAVPKRLLTPSEQLQDCCDCRPPEQLSMDCNKDGMVGTAFIRKNCYNV